LYEDVFPPGDVGPPGPPGNEGIVTDRFNFVFDIMVTDTTTKTLAINPRDNDMPLRFQVEQSYPMPFNEVGLLDVSLELENIWRDVDVYFDEPEAALRYIYRYDRVVIVAHRQHDPVDDRSKTFLQHFIMLVERSVFTWRHGDMRRVWMSVYNKLRAFYHNHTMRTYNQAKTFLDSETLRFVETIFMRFRAYYRLLNLNSDEVYWFEDPTVDNDFKYHLLFRH
jgi:hypothetical protein